jgi:hypothetical protein
MDLASFHQLISDEANQGDRLDSAIPTYVRRGARYIERNYNFLYMERFTQISVDVSVSQPRFVSWPSALIKKFDFIRFYSAEDEEYRFLLPVDPKDVRTIETDFPSGYWLSGSDDGVGYLVLDQVPDENFDLETKTVRFTDWPTSTTATPYLINHGEAALVAATMMQMSAYAGEPDWMAQYQPILLAESKAMIDADVDARNAGDSAGFVMRFSRE